MMNVILSKQTLSDTSSFESGSEMMRWSFGLEGHMGWASLGVLVLCLFILRVAHYVLFSWHVAPSIILNKIY